MAIEIKDRDDTVLYTTDAVTLREAAEAAVRSGADLRGANLGEANLGWADLGGANLRGANLRDAKGIRRELITPLLHLLDQPGLIRAYKLVTARGEGPFNGGIVYRVGEQYAVQDADTDPLVDCGRGINLADLQWCVREWQPGYRILVAEFTAQDIACIPTATDGKFRVHRCSIVGEKDLVALGLVEATPATTSPAA